MKKRFVRYYVLCIAMILLLAGCQKPNSAPVEEQPKQEQTQQEQIVPDVPADQEEPDEPETPEEVPDEPEIPEVPSEAEPPTPEEPEEPEEPVEPVEPAEPETPEEPEKSPAISTEPQVPEAPAEPEVPIEPEESEELSPAEQIELAVKKATMQPTLAYIGSIIDYYYLDPVDIDALVEKALEQVQMDTEMEDAIKWMVEGLEDPYSIYYTPIEYQNVMDSSSGNYCGIGATIQKDEETGGIRIVEPFKDGPAVKAGLRTDDIIMKIDGMDATTLDLDTAVTYVKGEQGTSVELEVLRGEETLTITVVRDFVTVETVIWRMETEEIGYIKISQFDEVTSDQFNTAVAELEAEGMKSLIVDLRNNPGGLLAAVAQILERILPEGKLITYTEDKYGNRDTLYTSDGDQLDMPLVVLVNENSASASELFTGAIKDYEVGTIIGANTFGKGIVQGFLQFTDGSALKLTISKYYTPNGVCIHETGICPDYLPEQPNEQEDGTDESLDLAVELLELEME